MEKLKFEFAVIPKPDDTKTNIFGLISIEDTEKNQYTVPKELQPINLHEELVKTEIFKLIKNTIKKRYEKRAVWITLTPTLEKIYFDNENMQFSGFLLEKAEIRNSNDTVHHVEKKQNKLKLVEKFSIEKFSKTTTNVSQWLNLFNKECLRLELNTDTEKVEMLRLMLDDSCKDWYSSMLIKNSVESEWSTWEKSLTETYADKSWIPVKYAMNFKYLKGSILDYALKKEKLLLEINSSIDKSLLIDMIACGLPNFITDKIDRQKLKEVDDLFNNLRGLEHLIKDHSNNKNEKDSPQTKQNLKKQTNKKEKSPCKICDQKGKKDRFHSETLCWYNKEKTKEDPLTNTLLNVQLSDEDPKN